MCRTFAIFLVLALVERSVRCKHVKEPCDGGQLFVRKPLTNERSIRVFQDFKEKLMDKLRNIAAGWTNVVCVGVLYLPVQGALLAGGLQTRTSTSQLKKKLPNKRLVR